MGMNPRTLRPSRSVPTFSEKGYSRIWALTNKSSGAVSGVAETDTGLYAVKWWDGTTELLASGESFSKAAVGGLRAFEVYPTSASIDEPTGAVSATPQTELLLSFDGSLNDSSGNARNATAGGGAVISTAESKWGASSLYLDGDNSEATVPLSSDFEFGTGDFTVEAWVYHIAGDSLRIAGLGVGPNASPQDTTGWSVWIRDGGQIWLYRYAGVSEEYVASPIESVPTDQWVHVCVMRKSGTVFMFANGVNVATHPGYNVALNAVTSEPLYIGSIKIAGFWQYPTAYISDVRIIKGLAHYEMSTAPSGQFDGLDISGNALKSVRAEGVSMDVGSSYYQTAYPYLFIYNPIEGAILSNNALDAAALNQFYSDLLAGGGYLAVSGNPGTDADDPAIATAKGYTVFGSVPPSTALLLHFDGNFNDSSPNELAISNSGVVISTAQSKWGGSSAYFDGSAYATVTLPSGMAVANDFTVECWVRCDYVGGGIQNICNFGGVLAFGVSNSDFFVYDSGNFIAFALGAASAGQWQHVAVVREGVAVRIYVDGAEMGVGYSATPSASTSLTIGNVDGGLDLFSGYIDDLRIVSGVALYASPFTPPSAPLGVYP